MSTSYLHSSFTENTLQPTYTGILFYVNPGQSREYSGLDGREVGDSFFLHIAQACSGAGSLAVKWLGREADRSSQTSAKVKNTWIYTHIPAYVFLAWCLIS
jgi:hypothetical protein